LFAEVTPTSELVCPNDPVQIWLLVALEVAELLLLLLACRHMDRFAVLEHERALEKRMYCNLLLVLQQWKAMSLLLVLRRTHVGPGV